MAAFAVMLTGIVAAGILGFSAHRTGVCTVKAVAEISRSGRAYMLASFANAALWVILLTATLGLVIGPGSALSPAWGFSTSTLIAGLVFGIGAAMNSACVFSTLSGLADGRVAFLFSILGLAAGAYLPAIVPALSTADSAEPLVHVAEQSANALVIIALLPWAMWQSRRLWQGRPRELRLWSRMGARVYRLSTGALIIGLANGVLFYLFGNWMFTAMLDGMIQGILPQIFDPL